MHPTQSQSTPKPQPALRLSALEVGAKRGIGPLSDQGALIWHGNARPCVSCGELMRREGKYCEHCGQDHSLAMLSRMQAHAGPWYVHEHVRPFPGVTLDRLIRQAKRGVLTGATIVRGPHTHHQWQFAAETPGLSKYVGFCFSCQCAASEDETYCSSCGIHLDRVPGEPETPPRADKPQTQNAPTSNQSADNIAAAAKSVASSASNNPPASTNPWDQISSASRYADDTEFATRRATRIPAWGFVMVLIVLFVAALFFVVRIRDNAIAESRAKKKAAIQAKKMLEDQSKTAVDPTGSNTSTGATIRPPANAPSPDQPTGPTSGTMTSESNPKQGGP